MAYYYSIPIEEMEEELESLRFYPVNLVFRNKPVKEWVYERKLPRSPNHFVRIYTGIQRYGQSAGESRKAGKDAIRIQVIYRDAKGETLVSQTKRVHRVGGWRKNLHKRMDEVSTELPQVEFDSRGEPMTLRKKGKNQFWGSRDYPKFKETKPFRAEGDNQVIRFDTLEEFHKYVKEHPYYDVEDAKRRVLMRAESREEFQQFSQTQPVIILDFECYAWRGLKADTVGVAYNHVVPLSNVSFQNLGGNLLPRDLIKEYGEPQSAAFIFNQDYQERNRSYGYLQNMKINLKGIPFSINWSWSYPEKLELWLWKIPLNSIENQDELNFTDIVKLNPIEGRMWNQHQQRRELYAAEDRLNYRAEGEDELIADFKNMSKKERDAYAPDNWKIEMYWAADGSTYILRRIFKPESYGAAVDLIDEINVIAAELDHHALITFDKERVMVQLWTHDVHNITELDIAFAQLLNQFADKWELNAESPEWDDIDWKTDKPPKEHEDWGDDVEWDAEDEEITMKEFDDTTADDFVKDSDDQITLMLRKKSKINRYGDIGCPVCGSIGLFSEEIIAKGKKWYCYGCLYEDKEETIKGKGDITLEKYGLEITCPICKKAVKAFNNDSMLRHIKKCGVPK